MGVCRARGDEVEGKALKGQCLVHLDHKCELS
jgi:hypothetical protein